MSALPDQAPPKFVPKLIYDMINCVPKIHTQIKPRVAVSLRERARAGGGLCDTGRGRRVVIFVVVNAALVAIQFFFFNIWSHLSTKKNRRNSRHSTLN